jgi:cell division protease FtsH
VFIDELDAVGATPGKDISGEKDQPLNQLLVEMDSFSSADNIVVIAASNLLDPALLRPRALRPTDLRLAARPHRAPGGLPARALPRQAARRGRLELIARQTSGLTGADLANICNEAAIFAGRSRRDVILAQDFDAVLERGVAGMQSRRVIADEEKQVIASHEAGHDLSSEFLPVVERVHKISIVPRGARARLHAQLPEEDRYL